MEDLMRQLMHQLKHDTEFQASLAQSLRAEDSTSLRKSNNWYVITGAPSTGKTSVLTEIEQRGYRVVHEAARSYIDEQMALGRTLNDIRRSEGDFQRIVLDRKIQLESELPRDELIFMERGHPDSLAYARFCGLSIEPQKLEIIRQSHYRKVFLLEPLSTYEQDYARVEDAQDAARIQRLLFEAYDGHTPITKVPPLPVDQRVAFILEHLDRQ